MTISKNDVISIDKFLERANEIGVFLCSVLIIQDYDAFKHIYGVRTECMVNVCDFDTNGPSIKQLKSELKNPQKSSLIKNHLKINKHLNFNITILKKYFDLLEEEWGHAYQWLQANKEHPDYQILNDKLNCGA